MLIMNQSSGREGGGVFEVNHEAVTVSVEKVSLHLWPDVSSMTEIEKITATMRNPDSRLPTPSSSFCLIADQPRDMSKK